MKEPLEGNFGLIKPFENQGGEDLTDARNDSEMLSPGEKADVLRYQLALKGLDPYNSAHVITTADELGFGCDAVCALKGQERLLDSEEYSAALVREKADVLQSQLALRGLDPYNSAHVMTTADELGADYRVVGALKGRRIKRCSE